MEVSAILARMALHYWRPDFTPEQTKLLIADYLHDLEEFSPALIETACSVYRKDGKNQFFPKSGQLIELMRPKNPEGEPLYRHARPFTGYPKLEGPRATASVAEILEKHGYAEQARAWRNRKLG